jgi:hypothetical protein
VQEHLRSVLVVLPVEYHLGPFDPIGQRVAGGQAEALDPQLFPFPLTYRCPTFVAGEQIRAVMVLVVAHFARDAG